MSGWQRSIGNSDDAVRFGPGPIACSECCGECRHTASLNTTIAHAPACIPSPHSTHCSRSRRGDPRLRRPGLDRRGHPAMDGQQHRLLTLWRIARHVAAVALYVAHYNLCRISPAHDASEGAGLGRSRLDGCAVQGESLISAESSPKGMSTNVVTLGPL